MTIESDRALTNAIPLELKKDGLQQRQSGDWVLRVVIQQADMDQRIINAPMGARFAAAIVEINDDETAKENPKAKDWRDKPPHIQAGIRCTQPMFWAFLREENNYDVDSEEGAAEAVRKICAVGSRADLNKPGFHRQRVLWHSLDDHYLTWLAVQHVL